MKQMVTILLCAGILFLGTPTAWAASDISIIHIASFAESCTDAEDGYLLVTAQCANCIGAIEYSTDNTNFQASNTLTSLADGNYTLYIRDAGNTSCATSQTTSIAANATACDDCDNSTAALAQLKLLASDGAASDFFGISVSISGNYAIVGSHWDDKSLLVMVQLMTVLLGRYPSQGIML